MRILDVSVQGLERIQDSNCCDGGFPVYPVMKISIRQLPETKLSLYVLQLSP